MNPILILVKVVGPQFKSSKTAGMAWSLAFSTLWAPLSEGFSVVEVPRWEHLFWGRRQISWLPAF